MLGRREDPIGIYRKALITQGTATQAELDALDEKTLHEIQEAVQFAEASPEPAPETLFQNIYADGGY